MGVVHALLGLLSVCAPQCLLDRTSNDTLQPLQVCPSVLGQIEMMNLNC
jgi:hypothetical protein